MGLQGNIAVDCTDGKPVGLFKEYLDDPERTKAAMVGNYYITGDKGYKDKDGYIWFDSRSDDVIITSGYVYTHTHTHIYIYIFLPLCYAQHVT